MHLSNVYIHEDGPSEVNRLRHDYYTDSNKTFTNTKALDGYTPGEDYPVYTEVPKGLSFTCQDKIPGYYADPETQCQPIFDEQPRRVQLCDLRLQVWHWCVPGLGGNTMYSFVCAPGTVFNQRTRVCDWFYKVDCQNAPSYYSVNEDLYKDEAGNYIAGKK
ncbi:hypothetical protein EVAR_40198_1 [Eumeta japonica]|uniref:Chitin-binding type-2 domain-containing protein n=1 Tax=Eumeta variegata TaxID=151549 RepID=A0A4C1XNW3_EUMVA|nr:hypothetical protein EVAR_40198_1 [Eumeta japonica]